MAELPLAAVTTVRTSAEVGGAEVLLSDSERLAEAAAESLVDVTLQLADGLPHVYHGALDTPETVGAIRQIAGFTRQF